MKKYPTCFDVYSVTSKQVGDFFQIFVAFSEKLNLEVNRMLFTEGNIHNENRDRKKYSISKPRGSLTLVKNLRV